MKMGVNNFRVQISMGDTKLIPQIAYNVYKKRLVKPTKQEGFDEIVEVDFCLDFKTLEPEFFYKYDL